MPRSPKVIYYLSPHAHAVSGMMKLIKCKNTHCKDEGKLQEGRLQKESIICKYFTHTQTKVEYVELRSTLLWL